MAALFPTGRAVSPLPTVRTVGSVRELVRGWRDAGCSVALVPTMGNLHEGHLSLARLARVEAERVIMSVFVNRTQFGQGEDFEGYPRTPEDDDARAGEGGLVDGLFVPEEKEVYPFGTEDPVRVTMPALSRELCGASRPGHFDGVASVVCRLLNIVTPDCLVLGRKDYQQLILLERMVADLRLPVRVVSAPIQREPDGLALSSRNRYLTADERARAPGLHAALEDVRKALAHGAANYAELEAQALSTLRAAGFDPDYVEVRRASDLAKPTGADEALVVLGAARLGRARLIDNVRV
jgi:pantoate--beta-alanine ligase